EHQNAVGVVTEAEDDNGVVTVTAVIPDPAQFASPTIRAHIERALAGLEAKRFGLSIGHRGGAEQSVFEISLGEKPVDRGAVIKSFERIARRERIPLSFAGAFTSGEQYEAHDLVQAGGTLWLCKAATTEKPGKSDAWRLLVKHAARD